MDLLGCFKALSNSTRLQMLRWLRDPSTHFSPPEFPSQDAGDVEDVGVCVSYIQRKSGLSQSTVSEYLSALERADLVSSERIGQWTYYRRNEGTIEELSERIRSEL